MKRSCLTQTPRTPLSSRTLARHTRGSRQPARVLHRRSSRAATALTGRARGGCTERIGATRRIRRTRWAASPRRDGIAAPRVGLSAERIGPRACRGVSLGSTSGCLSPNPKAEAQHICHTPRDLSEREGRQSEDEGKRQIENLERSGLDDSARQDVGGRGRACPPWLGHRVPPRVRLSAHVRHLGDP